MKKKKGNSIRDSVYYSINLYNYFDGYVMSNVKSIVYSYIFRKVRNPIYFVVSSLLVVFRSLKNYFKYINNFLETQGKVKTRKIEKAEYCLIMFIRKNND